MTSDDFCPFLTPPPPLIRCFISAPLLIKSDLAEPPSPTYHLTSYMDGPLRFNPKQTEGEGIKMQPLQQLSLFSRTKFTLTVLFELKRRIKCCLNS